MARFATYEAGGPVEYKSRNSNLMTSGLQQNIFYHIYWFQQLEISAFFLV